MGLWDDLVKSYKESYKKVKESGASDKWAKDVAHNIMESATKLVRDKYYSMSTSELKAEWEKCFKNRRFTSDEMYQPNSPNAILDEVYEKRISYKNWKYQYDQEQRRIRAKREEEAEQIRREMAQKRAEEEARAKRLAFKNSLSDNEMVKQIISKINDLEYSAFFISVYEDEVVVLNEKEKEILSIKYVRYGYPKINNEQIKDLTDYLQNNLKLKYELNKDNTLELNDAPGGMKTSW